MTPEAIRRGDIPGVQLRCRAQVGIQTADAWDWLTEPDRLERWLATRALAGPSPGIDFALELSAEDGRDLLVELRTLEIESESRWVVAWQEMAAGWPVATRLTLALDSHHGETGVSVFQQGFEHLPLSDCLTIWERYRRFWRQALDRLSTVAD